MTLLPETDSLLRVVHAAAASKHARDPVALDVHELSSFADALYVCHAETSRGVQAILDAVLVAVRAAGLPSPRVEGADSLTWVLLDFGDVMAHVFVRDRREYYNLERLWHDAPQVVLEAA